MKNLTRRTFLKALGILPLIPIIKIEADKPKIMHVDLATGKDYSVITQIDIAELEARMLSRIINPPILADRGNFIFISTPRSTNLWYKRFKNVSTT